jgi:hypothetical protein
MGNNPGYVSLFLDADIDKMPEGWHACAQFAMRICNSTDETVEHVQGATLDACVLIIGQSHIIDTAARHAIGDLTTFYARMI